MQSSSDKTRLKADSNMKNHSVSFFSPFEYRAPHATTQNLYYQNAGNTAQNFKWNRCDNVTKEIHKLKRIM